MTPRQVGITVDCADADQLAAFWERFLGYTRRSAAPGSPYVTIDRGDDGPDGPPFLTFQTVPEPKRGQGSTSPRSLRRSRPALCRGDVGGRSIVGLAHRGRGVDDSRAPGSSRQRVLRHRT